TKGADIVLALALFCAPAQVDVGDLIKGVTRPMGRAPGITLSPGPRGFCPIKHDATGNDACGTAPKAHGRPVGGGRGERGFRWRPCAVVTGCRERSLSQWAPSVAP